MLSLEATVVLGCGLGAVVFAAFFGVLHALWAFECARVGSLLAWQWNGSCFAVYPPAMFFFAFMFFVSFSMTLAVWVWQSVNITPTPTPKERSN